MKKKLVSNLIVVILMLAMVLPPANANAATTVTAQKIADDWVASLSENVIVTLERTGGIRETPYSHSDTAQHNFELAIKVSDPEFTIGVPGRRTSKGKYKKISYNKAVIETQGDVTAQRFDVNPFNDRQVSGPGLTYLRVSATTSTDVRNIPREERQYTLIFHLTGVKGVRGDGSVVDLGDHKIVFSPLQFSFLHAPAKMPTIVNRPTIRDATRGRIPDKASSENVEGPTPILIDEDGKVTILPGESIVRIEGTTINVPIPPDFFGPGSEPFNATVKLTGVEGADTVVRRLDPMELSSPLPSTDTIPVELISLSLVSVQPITVTLNDGSQTLWNVEVGLSGTITPTGTMTVTQTRMDGGTYAAEIPVYPFIVFTKVDGAETPKYGDSIGGGQLEGGRLVYADRNNQPVRYISFLSGEWGCGYECPAELEDLPLLEETFVFKVERIEDA